ncbi:MAG TPA: hypothetical protein VIM86_11390 [Thermodesulfobacteriota bacterium]
MRKTYAGALAALALGMVAAGCGGDDGNGGGGVPSEERTFVFTVSVPGAPPGDLDPAFFRDEALSEAGVTLASQTNPNIGEASASVIDQDRASGVPGPFTLAVHFDASGSIDDNGRDPDGNRFTAAEAVVDEIDARRSDATPRFFTFRFDQGHPQYGTQRFREVASISGARAEGADGFSPALTASINILDQAVPSGNVAMLLLTDGENNAEDPARVSLQDCDGGEASDRTDCSDDIGKVDEAAGSRARIYVVGLGNVDTALEKFKDLANATGAVYVKASRAEQLETQFRALGALIASGGVVVTGQTGNVNVTQGGNPFVRGWMRFNKNGAPCPPGTQEHDADTCKVQF